MLKAFLYWLSGGEGFLSILEFRESFSIYGYEVWQEEDRTSFRNQDADGFYRKTARSDQKSVETIGLQILDRRGALTVTFIDDEVETLHHNGIKIENSQIHDQDKMHLFHILLKIRHIVAYSE